MQGREIRYKVWGELPKYEVGSNGTVYSLNYNNSGKRKQIKSRLDADGHEYVILVVNSKRHKRLVHRMVAICFIDNPGNKPQVNHKDGVRNNNDIENLEWVTSRENTLHGYRSNGRKPSEKQIAQRKEMFGGTNNPKAKLDFEQVLSLRKKRSSGTLVKHLAAEFGISVAQVSAIANNKFWHTSPLTKK